MASEQLSLKRRLITVAINYADLGFTSFGGPPVHFGILYDRFVKKLGWIDDKTYQELFAVSQALPGPASTKLAFAIALNYAASQATEAEGARPPFTIRLVPGLTVIGLFFALFVTLMGLRAHFSKLVELRLFTNMVLAGTIIFGGGPVVIPLLREYIVQEGWVSSRDFLLGLAIIQSFPGPNFNFSVYLGALASASTSTPSWVTALLAYIGIFLPGLMLTTGMSSIWARIPRQYRPFVSSLLRGINAAAVGLIWTAVYRLWNAGNLTHSSVAANSLGSEPWWLVVATAAFAGHQWYSVPAPLCIVLGGCMGLGWWAVN
ncbi:hypothetical protein FRC20_010168 [Serendipita sp. 405]|nr:hypothetical protein FRC20_010168 [Serendipita sp. 405]